MQNLVRDLKFSGGWHAGPDTQCQVSPADSDPLPKILKGAPFWCKAGQTKPHVAAPRATVGGMPKIKGSHDDTATAGHFFGQVA